MQARKISNFWCVHCFLGQGAACFSVRWVRGFSSQNTSRGRHESRASPRSNISDICTSNEAEPVRTAASPNNNTYLHIDVVRTKITCLRHPSKKE